ncbi:membrane-bound inhibitor of C-type lysozyme [Angulomicrobium tetraedrale]|uniref:Membrane-bound inhibitor of C-type lysozyme n=1 Tax=Ancylobacter tetraedralis TaxID=217068 RepID=A0A839ZCD9_9HYPH|nr:MliC family protein [Ancylobacter tetraedralis]MBB3772356.1 membrane-bound inhibitor of C-type lysozyme [Ancylobacter tetraedralis]
MIAFAASGSATPSAVPLRFSLRAAVRVAMPVLVALLAGAGAARAADRIVIALPKGSSVVTTKVGYTCDKVKNVAATYINAPPTALATIAFDHEFVVMANVLAGSGAKYAGDRFVWWTKGNSASLYDLTKGENAPPIATCTQD